MPEIVKEPCMTRAHDRYMNVRLEELGRLNERLSMQERLIDTMRERNGELWEENRKLKQRLNAFVPILSKGPSRIDLADAKRTERVKALYERLFETPWPKGWKIHWRVEGITLPMEKAIYLSCYSMSDPYDLQTIVHELCHMHDPTFSHGPKFEAKVRELSKKAKGI